MKPHSHSKLKDPIFQYKPEHQKLTIHDKNLYLNFNIFELQMCRYCKYPIFASIVQQISLFNDELIKWKNNSSQISNIVTTYHLYENLFSRLRYISNLARSEQEALESITQINRWFFTEKPKIRNQVKEVKASMKSVSNKSLNENVEIIVPTTQLQKEMQSYDLKARTAHAAFFPPKQSLKEFKRKQFLPLGDSTFSEQPFTMKKSFSSTLFPKVSVAKDRESITTLMGTTARTNFKIPRDSIKSISEFKPDQIKSNENIAQVIQQNKNEENNQTGQANENKQEGAQEGHNDKIDDEEDQFDEEIEQQPKKGFQIYVSDHDQPTETQQKQLSSAQHFGITKHLKINQAKIKTKLEEAQVKKNFIEWEKNKSQTQREEVRRRQNNVLRNKYNCLKFQTNQPSAHVEQKQFFSATTGFHKLESIQEKKQESQLHGGKGSSTSVEEEIQKFRVTQMKKIYGKYISKHVKTNDQDEEIEGNKEFKSKSLTSLPNQPKKMGFSITLKNLQASEYNQPNMEQIINMKTVLSSKKLAVQKNILYAGLSVPKQTITVKKGIFANRSSKNLLSNPFFPKTKSK